MRADEPFITNNTSLHKYNFQTISTFFVSVILFFIPFARFLWDDWTQYLLFLLILCVWIFFFYDGERTIYFPALSIKGILFLLFTAFFLGSSLLSPIKESVRVQSLVLVNAISCFYFSTKLPERSKTILQTVFCLASSLFSLFFIFSHLFPNSFPPRLVSEFFINPNVAGIFSLLALFVAINCYHQQQHKFFIFSILLNALSFLWARSFGSWIAASVAFIYLYRTNKTGVLIAAGGSALLLFSYGIFHSDWLAHRLHWWAAAFQIVSRFPLFGSGPGTFSQLFSAFMEPGIKSQYAHNFYLQTASEWGVPAALIFFLYLLLKIKAVPRNFLSAGLVALLFQNLYDYSMNLPGFFICFCIFLGIVSEKQREPDIPLKPFLRIYRFPTVALLLFSGWGFGIKPLLSFSATLQAQKAFEKNNLKEAENHLREAIALDPLPSKTWSDLSKLLWTQYQINKENSSLLKEAFTFQKEALRRNPFSKELISAEKVVRDDKKR